MQHDAPQDLDLVSRPAGMPLPLPFGPWNMKGFVYDVFSGNGTYVYVIGDGLNLNHRVS